jgi:hypothetical protein
LFVRGGIFKLLWSLFIDSKESIPRAFVACVGFVQQFIWARNRVGIGLSYRPPGYICWRNWFLESILELLKSIKIRPLVGRCDTPILSRFLAPIDCCKIPAQGRFFHLPFVIGSKSSLWYFDENYLLA